MQSPKYISDLPFLRKLLADVLHRNEHAKQERGMNRIQKNEDLHGEKQRDLLQMTAVSLPEEGENTLEHQVSDHMPNRFTFCEIGGKEGQRKIKYPKNKTQKQRKYSRRRYNSNTHLGPSVNICSHDRMNINVKC